LADRGRIEEALGVLASERDTGPTLAELDERAALAERLGRVADAARDLAQASTHRRDAGEATMADLLGERAARGLLRAGDPAAAMAEARRLQDGPLGGRARRFAIGIAVASSDPSFASAQIGEPLDGEVASGIEPAPSAVLWHRAGLLHEGVDAPAAAAAFR